MKDVKWIKLDVSIFDDDKIKEIRSMENGDSIALLWIFLLCIAGKKNDNGFLYLTPEIPYTDEMISRNSNIPLEIVKEGLAKFEELELIEIIDDMAKLSNWSKWQAVDGLEKIREQNRDRVRKYRENKAKSAEASSESEPPKPTPLERRFAAFWAVYPKKVGKGAAEKSFAKYKPDDELTTRMIQAVQAARRSEQWQKDGGQYIPNPATWLNQKRWEDEIQPAAAPHYQPSLEDRGLENWDEW